MSLAHLTLPSLQVEQTAVFLEKTLGYTRDPLPANVQGVWLNIGQGQQVHLVHVEGFAVSPFEREFGRHVAVFYPRPQFEGLKQRLTDLGAELIEPMRAVAFERLFFREPINGYVFEVIAQDPGASHLDQ